MTCRLLTAFGGNSPVGDFGVRLLLEASGNVGSQDAAFAFLLRLVDLETNAKSINAAGEVGGDRQYLVAFRERFRSTKRE